MKQTLYIYLMAACALLFAACSDDNLSSPTEGVEGAGTLSFTVTGEYPAFEQTPETRSSGIGIYDQGKTQWETGDEIMVQVRYTDNTGTGIILTRQADGTWQSNGVAASNDKEVYRIIAVYAPTKTIRTDGNFESKDEASAYEGEYIQLECQAVNNVVEIDFSRAARTYSRLRIATEVGKSVSIAFNSFTDPEETVYSGGGGLITTLTPDGKGNAYIYGSWDAGSTLSVTIGSETKNFTLNDASVDGQAYTVDCRQSTDLDTTTQPILINGDGDFHYRGSGSQPINITGGRPNVYLYNANVNVNDVNAISITGDNTNATIIVLGTCSANQNSRGIGAAIYVAEGCTVNIIGNSRNDKLTAHVNQGGCGIGGSQSASSSFLSCGNINISNVTVDAMGRCYGSGYNSGIGSAGNANCGNISIQNATVYAYSGGGSNFEGGPAIGLGMSSSYASGQIGIITITNSDVYAYRGGGSSNSYADYIGYSGVSTNPRSGYATDLDMTITSTTVYQYRYFSTTGIGYSEGSSSFDENGVRTENP